MPASSWLPPGAGASRGSQGSSRWWWTSGQKVAGSRAALGLHPHLSQGKRWWMATGQARPTASLFQPRLVSMHGSYLKYFPWTGFQAAKACDTVQRLPKNLPLEAAPSGRTAKIKCWAHLIHLLQCNFIDFNYSNWVVCSQRYAPSSLGSLWVSAALSLSAALPIHSQQVLVNLVPAPSSAEAANFSDWCVYFLT